MEHHVLMWDENKVSKWMSSIGYSCYEKQFKEQGITGDVLVNLDHESLRDLSVLTVGQRMDLLKNIYQLKIHYRVPVNEWDYIPPSVLYETDWLGQNGMADYRKIEAAFQERDARIKRLTEDLQRVNTDMLILKEEMSQILKYSKENSKKNDANNNSSTNKLSPKLSYPHLNTKLNSPTTKLYNINTNNNNNSNNNNNNSSSSNSGINNNSNNNNSSSISLNSINISNTTEESKPIPHVTINDGGAIKVYGEKISKVEQEPESSKNVRLLLDDPTSKVIMSALRKYNVVSDWQQYALWIQFGSSDNIQERALSYDEKPLRISQKLKEAKQNPVFVLKHVKDNKPFNPANYANPRPAPPPKPQQSNSKPNNNITSGKVGFEVVIPVMSTSVSSPTTAQPPLQTTNNSTKRNQQQNQRESVIYDNELGLDKAVVNAIFSINNTNQ